MKCFRQFEQCDALRIDLRELEKQDLSGYSLWERAFYWSNSPIAKTLEDDGVVIACGGVFLDVDGHGNAWIMTSDLISKYVRPFYEMVKEQADVAFDVFGCRRVQTLVYVENPLSKRFVEKLGFECEGLIRSCGLNHLDRYIYARVK